MILWKGGIANKKGRCGKINKSFAKILSYAKTMTNYDNILKMNYKKLYIKRTSPTDIDQ